ncbi:unnamed protein product [Prunus armeniaca]
MLNESRQHHHRRAPNVDSHRQSHAKTYSCFADACLWGIRRALDEIARMRKSTILECLVRFCDAVENLYKKEYLLKPTARDLRRLVQKAEARVFNNVLRGHSPQITYRINNTIYSGAYYLADGIYPRWTTLVKTIPNPQSEKEKSFVAFQEGYRKDVERCFGILQARWAIIRGVTRMLYEEMLRSIMMTCIILYNMIVEDEYEYDYDASKVFEPDPMNTALTRIYERQMGRNG